jgi:hypothetical protein
MGHTFKGFFTKDESVAKSAKDKWPFCQLKESTGQVDCFIVRCPDENDLHPAASQEEYEAVCEQYISVEEGISEFSTEHAHHLLVYLEADCFGGVCDYTGFHVQDGTKTKIFDDHDAPAEILKEIVAPLDVKWNKGIYFEPLVRGYFDG